MSAQSNKIMQRYTFICILFVLLGLAVLVRAGYLMLAERSYWEAVSERFVRVNVEVKPNRGNIISADGQLMASSLPEYKIYMDFVAGDRDPEKKMKEQHWRDSVFHEKLNSIADGLHRLFPDKSAREFRKHLLKGRSKNSRHWLVYPKRVSYIKYKEAKKLPLFCYGPYKGGFYAAVFDQRKKPFGSLATRTLGDLYPGKDSARYGLEMSYDSILRGTPGITHRQKVRNKYLNIIDVPPQDGMDIVTTIDVEMQDICEKALADKLKEIDAQHGVAILMETATGDVKGIVNLSRCADGRYRELNNMAVSNLMEPGSVFKTASFMVAFEDGYIHMTDSLDVGCGIMEMHGRKMRDHNWRRGGYQWLTVPEVLEYSSNIGVSYLIDKNYFKQPEKFVDGLYRTGIAEDLKLDIPGYAAPRIRRPKKDGSNWSKTALAWMSIGYETQVPPISTLAFYNGIANGGRMMRPRFVKAVMKNGEVIKEYPTVAVREQMCSPATLKNIQTCLEWVVSRGLGKKAGSKNFLSSGKTGTAQIWTREGFASQYLVSFVGYFPSDAPRYSCIVCIQKGVPASGGGQCGPVFRRISEAVMSRYMNPSMASVRDTLYTHRPIVKEGNLKAAETVLAQLDIPYRSAGAAEWGTVETAGGEIRMRQRRTDSGLVPDVTGMGARDAVYLMERQGLKAVVRGLGRVTKQSLRAGEKIRRGQQIVLTLENEFQHKLKEQQMLIYRTADADSTHGTPGGQQAASPKKQEP